MSTDAGVWGPSVSGKVDAGETFDEAVRREANEELGLTTTDISPIFLHKETYGDHSDGRKREFVIFYAAVPSSITEQLKLEANEVSDIRWFRKDELQRLVNIQSNDLIIASAKELWYNILLHLSPALAT